ncbi:Coiled-coil domain-containing protein 191 [Trichoplax sp. H2]|nr:Coiled-coil domain-containing protein 191 [Trichoplax sp. H2]|eukprot:RDD44480.1 Coiled-coil domain-containing protein 191 [Trichoplax sp. H2]
MAESGNSSLFRWRRINQPAKARSKYKTSYTENDHLDELIQEVNNQIDPSLFAHVTGHADLSAYDYIQDDDSAQAEAKEILDNWMNEKFTGDMPIVDEDYSHIDQDSYDVGFPLVGDDLDETVAVQKVLDELLKKPLQGKAFRDLGLETHKKTNNPKTRMEIRQQQMKQKWEARRQKEAKAKQLITKRQEATKEAKKIVDHEEKHKLARARREEQEINREMVRIRKLMAEQARAEQEQREREEFMRMEAESRAKQDIESSNTMRLEIDREQRRKEQQELDKRKRLLKIKEMHAKRNLMLLRRHFSAWYTILAEKHLKIGKIRAIMDFKFKLKVWNAWRSYVRNTNAERETYAFQKSMRKVIRNEQIAIEHWRINVLQQCFMAWYHWSRTALQQRMEEMQHRVKKKKMAAFLEAAATGKLWNKDEPTGKQAKSIPSANVADDDMRYEIASVIEGKLTSGKSNIAHTESKHRKNQVKIDHNVGQDQGPKSAWSKSKISKSYGQKSSVYSSKPKSRPQEKTNIEEYDDGTRPFFSKATKSSKSTKSPRYDEIKIENIDAEAYSEFNEEVNDINDAVLDDTNSGTYLPNSRRSIQDDTVNKTEREDVKSNPNIELNDDKATISNLPSNLPTVGEKVNYKHISRDTAIVKKNHRIIKAPGMSAMEKRAREREERKRILEEKKRMQDEERLTKIKLEEEQRRLQEYAAKQTRIEKLKDEKRQTKQREIEKQQRIEHMAKINYQAELFRYRLLLTKYGVDPMKKLVKMTKRNFDLAAQHDVQRIKKFTLIAWHKVAEIARLQKEAVADDFYCMIITRKYHKLWIQYVKEARNQYVIAQEHNQKRLLQLYMQKWKKFTHEEVLFYWEKDRRAKKHDQRRLKLAMLKNWREFVPLHRKEKEKNRRKEELRRKVTNWLPDFSWTNKSDDEQPNEENN